VRVCAPSESALRADRSNLIRVIPAQGTATHLTCSSDISSFAFSSASNSSRFGTSDRTGDRSK
jgi:hypothetical protein